MLVEVGSYLKITDPSPEVMDWCKENLELMNPDYQKKVRMHLWTGNTPRQLFLYSMNGNDLILPFGCLRSLMPLIQDAEVVTKFTSQEYVEFGGTVPLYDYAVTKSASRVMVNITDSEFHDIVAAVISIIHEKGLEEIPVSEMHNIMEQVLEDFNPKVAKSYKDYRNYKKDFVHLMDEVYIKSQSIRFIGDKENANTDSALVATKRCLIFNELNKRLYRRFFIRNVRYLYDLIALLDYGKDTVERFEVSVGGSNFGQSNLTYGVQEVLEQFSRDKILPDDRISFRSFMDTGTLAHRLLNHGEGFLSDYFRMKEEDGSYAWHVVNILLLPKMNNQRFLLLTKKAAIDEKTIRHKLINLYHKDYGMGQGNLQEGPDFSAQVMWKNLTDYSTIKYFWKDMDRRFVGVSRSFLEYYGLESQADVIGKTDEDMHWHVADGPYKSDEEEVLRKGLHTSNVPDKCIIKGVLHNILASKMPIYRNGKIVGLFGCFYDVENGADVGDPRGTTIDLATGLSNVRGIMDDLITYTEEYRSSGTDFAAVNINLGGYEDFRGEYGNELAEKLLHQVAEILLKNFGTTASLGRLMSGRFIALVKVPDQVSLGETLQELKYEIQSIIEVDGHRCSPFPRISKTYAGESVSPEQIMKRILDLCDPKTLG